MNKEDFDKQNVFGLGEPNVNFAKYFIGNSYLNPVKGSDYLHISNVTFEPNCRNNWHVHNTKFPVGQILICTAGKGVYQEWGKSPVIMTPGTVVEIPAGAKHWHGAFPGSWFSHLAFSLPDETAKTDWLEPVDDETYEKVKAFDNNYIYRDGGTS